MSSKLVVRRTVIAMAVVVLALGGSGGGSVGLAATPPADGSASPAAAGDLEKAGRGDGTAPSLEEPGAETREWAAQVPAELLSGLRYRYVGPSRGGRVTAVAGHPARPSTFFMGATGGGVWKTTDYGRSWKPVSDGAFATGSIGAIAVAPSDPDVVYVATGSDGLRSNVIVGKGVYRSDDGGETWSSLGLEEIGNTGAVLVHPEDPDRAWVAAIGNPFAPNPERGVYRTLDGGESWEKVLFISRETGAVDLEFAPDDPDLIYATAWQTEREPWTIISGGHEGGVFRSEDGGDTWHRLTEGLPTGLRGKADLAVSAGDPDRVYVLIEAPDDVGGVYRSDDRGDTWRQVTDFGPIRTRPFYYTNLEAHPTDPDVLWGMTEGFWKSEDGGETWERKPTPHGDNHDMWIHPENPDLFIQSNDGGANVTRDGGETWSSQWNQPTAELYQVDVDDGFPYRLYAGQQDNTTISVPSLPPRFEPGGHTSHWQTHGGCETGPVIPKPGNPDVVYANCKGRFGLYDRRTGQERQYYVGFWDLYGRNPEDLKWRFQRVAPVHVSPHDPDRVYHGSQYVHVTENGGLTWRTISPDLTAFTPETQVVSGGPITRDVTGEEHFATLYEIRESPHEEGTIWVGANDGPIHLTRNGGDSWTEVTPPQLGPYGRVETIQVSPHDPAKAYVSVLRYQLGDFRPHAYKTEDYGATWEWITAVEEIADGQGGTAWHTRGIPADYPVRVVKEDPDREGLLYAGTEFGVFVSFDDGERWQPLQLNLPVTPVTDIEVHRQDLVLSTMGRGFWILYDLTPLHGVSADLASQPVHLYPVRDPVRIQTPRRFLFGERELHEPDYPPAGANLDYWLAEEPEGEIRLEILDSEGEVVREFGSADAESTAKEEEGRKEREGGDVEGDPAEERGGEGGESDEAGTMQEVEERMMPGSAPSLALAEDAGVAPELGTDVLPASAGMHRFVWNLRRAGPWSRSEERAGSFGPMVAPGRYTARLTVGDRSVTRTFQVKLDPRVEAIGITAADVAAQERFLIAARQALGVARAAALRIERALEGHGEGTDGSDRRKRLRELRDRLVTGEIRYSPRMLIDQLEYLYFNMNRADQRPGQDAYRRLEVLEGELGEILAELDEILPH